MRSYASAQMNKIYTSIDYAVRPRKPLESATNKFVTPSKWGTSDSAGGNSEGLSEPESLAAIIPLCLPSSYT